MTIASVDNLVAGFQPPRSFLKGTGTMPTVAALRAHSLFPIAGVPGIGTASAAGVAGSALVAPLAGCFPRSNPSSGLEARLARMAAYGTTAGMLLLVDRLWSNSGLSATLTTSQTVNSVAFPARDRNGSTNGEDVLVGVEVTATMGAGVPTLTLGYTNSAGTAGKTATTNVVAAAPVGTFDMFPLAAGDTGVRSIQTFQANATRTSGSFSLVAYRVIQMLNMASGNLGGDLDAISGALPRIYDDSCLHLMFLPTAVTATFLAGNFAEAHG